MAAGFEKIVVGFDRTDRGRDALVLGELLGRYTLDELLLARVEPAQEEGQTGCFANEISGLAGASQLVAKPLPLVGSSPSRALHELAEADRKVGLIVLGSTHRAGLGRVMPGSVAVRLLNGAPCCVAVAPRSFADITASGASDRVGDKRQSNGALPLAAELRVIAVRFDGSAESRAALDVPARLAGPAEAALRVIAVHDRGAWSGNPGAENPTGASVARADLEEQLHSAVGELPGELRALPVSEKGEPTAVLLERATERVDLLVIGSRGYGPVRTVLEGGVSAAILRRAPCPVLVTPRTALGRG